MDEPTRVSRIIEPVTAALLGSAERSKTVRLCIGGHSYDPQNRIAWLPVPVLFFGSTRWCFPRLQHPAIFAANAADRQGFEVTGVAFAIPSASVWWGWVHPHSYPGLSGTPSLSLSAGAGCCPLPEPPPGVIQIGYPWFGSLAAFFSNHQAILDQNERAGSPQGWLPP